MFCLMYFSFAKRDFTPEDLIALAAQSARNNAAVGITGMLMHEGGMFLQVLEGDEAAVRGLFAKISDDSRHSRLTVVLEGNIPARHFPDWHMALVDADKLTDEDRRIIRRLGAEPPKLPVTQASPLIEELMATFIRVTGVSTNNSL